MDLYHIPVGWIKEKAQYLRECQSAAIYQAYLRHNAWTLKRTQKLSQNPSCEYPKCQYTGKYLQVHHKNYDSLYDESMSDLETLCEYHHSKRHNTEYTPGFRRDRLPTTLSETLKTVIEDLNPGADTASPTPTHIHTLRRPFIGHNADPDNSP